MLFLIIIILVIIAILIVIFNIGSRNDRIVNITKNYKLILENILTSYLGTITKLNVFPGNSNEISLNNYEITAYSNNKDLSFDDFERILDSLSRILSKTENEASKVYNNFLSIIKENALM